MFEKMNLQTLFPSFAVGFATALLTSIVDIITAM